MPRTRKPSATPPTSPSPASTSSQLTPESVEISRRAWGEWRTAKRQAKLWTDIAKKKREVLEQQIGASTQATINNIAVISWKEGEKRNTFDMESFKKDHPELVAEYTIKKPGNRPFNETAHAAELDGDNEDEDE